jgi:uncharacterized protein YoxC
MDIKDKKITIEATFDEWTDMIKSLDQASDMMLMFRKLVKANIEHDGAKEIGKVLPEMIMGLQEQMSILKRGIMRDLSQSDMEAMVNEGIAMMKKDKE